MVVLRHFQQLKLYKACMLVLFLRVFTTADSYDSYFHTKEKTFVLAGDGDHIFQTPMPDGFRS